MLQLDAPVDGALLTGSSLHVEGWVHDQDSPVRDVTILFDGVPVARAGLTWARPDVAAAFGDPRMGLCGFDRPLNPPMSLRTPGPHSLGVEARLLDGRHAATPPVTIVLPEVPTLPEEQSPPVRVRRPMTGEPIRSTWLARSLDFGGSQLRMAETLEHLAARAWTTTVLS